MKARPTIAIRLYGPLSVRWADGVIVHINSRKAQVIMALLATAPDGCRSRIWLQDKLWSRVEKAQAQGSLRQELVKLQQSFGEYSKEILGSDKFNIWLKDSCWQVCGTSSEGEFLEGLDLNEEGFEEWLREARNEKPASYEVRLDSAPLKKSVSPLVAILPFRHVSGGDTEDSVLGDMFAEEMSRNLSRSNLFDTISHLSCRTLGQTKVVDIASVRAQLDADYVSTGCFRIHGDRYRLDLDITEIAANRIITSNQFEGSVKSFVKGEIAVLMEALQFLCKSIVDASVLTCASRPLPAVESHSVLMAAIGYMHRNELRYFARARNLIEELLSRHPEQPMLKTWLANWYVLSATQGWATQQDKAAQKAAELTDRALNAVPDCSFSLAMDGFVHSYLLRNFSKGLDRLEEAVETDRSNAFANLLKGVTYAFTGDGIRAVELTERANSLSPMDPQKYFYETLTATAHLSAENFDRASELADRALRRNPRHFSAHRTKVIALFGAGKLNLARSSAEELRRRDPQFNVSGYLEKHPASDYEIGRFWAKALRESGIPEN